MSDERERISNDDLLLLKRKCDVFIATLNKEFAAFGVDVEKLLPINSYDVCAIHEELGYGKKWIDKMGSEFHSFIRQSLDIDALAGQGGAE